MENNQKTNVANNKIGKDHLSAELDMHPNLAILLSGLVNDVTDHAKVLDRLSVFADHIEDLILAVESRVFALEQVKEPVAQERVTLPQDVSDFIKAVSCCDNDNDCYNCPYDNTRFCYSREIVAKELLKKYEVN